MNKNSRYITGGERGLAWTSLYTSVPMSPGSNRRRARIRSKQIISPLPVLSSYLQGFFSGGGGGGVLVCLFFYLHCISNSKMSHTFFSLKSARDILAYYCTPYKTRMTELPWDYLVILWLCFCTIVLITF